MYGWIGNVLHIDLTTRRFHEERPSPDVYTKFVGGKGLAGAYLKPHVTRAWDDAAMPLIFCTGPLVDTPSPTSGRMTVMSRSPLTGTIGDTSVGGSLGVNIKRAGWDGIVITGRATNLTGIGIHDKTVMFHDAEALAGQSTSATADALSGKGAMAIIGPAGENGTLFACIVVDRRYFAGRGGLGAVMGAKNLKYITVEGTGKTTIRDKVEVENAREQIFRLVAASPVLMGEFGIRHFGTGALYDLIQNRRMMPTDNFRRTWYEHADRMNSWSIREHVGGYKRSGCHGCHILCKRNDQQKRDLPEFETMALLTSLIENDDLDTLIEANRVCGEAGMDTISAAGVLGCYKELHDKKLTADEILGLLHDMAEGSGEGAALKLGSYRYAESMGRPECSMSVKKSELPGYDPRGVYGMALAYAVSTRGGCHLRAYPVAHEILRKPVVTDRFTFSGKARIIKISEDLFAMIDSLTACKFVFFAASLEEFSKAYHGVTGEPASAQDLLKIGERIYYNERIMNAMNGFSSEDDDLPPRFFNEPGTSGDGIEVKPIDREEFLAARSNYYAIRGLDEDGMPTRAKCEELELSWNS